MVDRSLQTLRTCVRVIKCTILNLDNADLKWWYTYLISFKNNWADPTWQNSFKLSYTKEDVRCIEDILNDKILNQMLLEFLLKK